MEESVIFDMVVEIVSEELSVDPTEITRETSFAKDLNADSLDLITIVTKMEDRFEMTIPDKDAEKITTVKEAVDYIKEHLPAETV